MSRNQSPLPGRSVESGDASKVHLTLLWALIGPSLWCGDVRETGDRTGSTAGGCNNNTLTLDNSLTGTNMSSHNTQIFPFQHSRIHNLCSTKVPVMICDETIIFDYRANFLRRQFVD